MHKYKPWSELPFVRHPDLANADTNNTAPVASVLTQAGATVKFLAIPSPSDGSFLPESLSSFVTKGKMFNNIKFNVARSTRRGVMVHWTTWESLLARMKAVETAAGRRYTHVIYAKDDGLWFSNGMNFTEIAVLRRDRTPKVIVFDCSIFKGRSHHIPENAIIYERSAIDRYVSIPELIVNDGINDIIEGILTYAYRRWGIAIRYVSPTSVPYTRVGKLLWRDRKNDTSMIYCLHTRCTPSTDKLILKHDYCDVIQIERKFCSRLQYNITECVVTEP